MTFKFKIITVLVHALHFTFQICSYYNYFLITSVRSPVFSQISCSSIPMPYIRVAAVARSELSDGQKFQLVRIIVSPLRLVCYVQLAPAHLLYQHVDFGHLKHFDKCVCPSRFQVRAREV